MKKSLILLLAVLLLSFSTVCAQGTVSAVELDWNAIAPAVEQSGVRGDFYAFDEIAMKVWIPEVFLPAELTDKDREDGYIAYFMTNDAAAAIAVTYLDARGTDLERFSEILSEYQEVTDIENIIVNGFPALSYIDTGQDSLNVTFATTAGYLLEFTFAPISDEGFQAMAALIAASIQEDN